jgi:hypothetical protein
VFNTLFTNAKAKTRVATTINMTARDGRENGDMVKFKYSITETTDPLCPKRLEAVRGTDLMCWFLLFIEGADVITSSSFNKINVHCGWCVAV